MKARPCHVCNKIHYISPKLTLLSAFSLPHPPYVVNPLILVVLPSKSLVQAPVTTESDDNRLLSILLSFLTQGGFVV